MLTLNKYILVVTNMLKLSFFHIHKVRPVLIISGEGIIDLLWISALHPDDHGGIEVVLSYSLNMQEI